MKITIAGIRGFIGSHLAARLVKDGHTTFETGRGQYVRDEMSGSDAFIYAGGPSKLVEHLTLDDTGRELLSWAYLLECAHAAKVGRVILLSSHAVYGAQKAQPITEDAPLRPRSLYGALQASREHIGMALHHSKGLPFTSLRLGTVYGPGMRADALVRVFLDAALNGGEIRLERGGEQIRPFVHIDDLTNLITIALHNADFVAGQAFNVAMDHWFVKNLATAVSDIAEAFGRKRPEILNIPARIDEVGNIVLNVNKAKTLLEWMPTIKLETGILPIAQAMMGRQT